jgi:hypothetical protein
MTNRIAGARQAADNAVRDLLNERRKLQIMPRLSVAPPRVPKPKKIIPVVVKTNVDSNIPEPPPGEPYDSGAWADVPVSAELLSAKFNKAFWSGGDGGLRPSRAVLIQPSDRKHESKSSSSQLIKDVSDVVAAKYGINNDDEYPLPYGVRIVDFESATKWPRIYNFEAPTGYSW